ncbi:hypothetical protein BpHYR1_042289 [Brachionus plicatilis]|uniref:Uncharacterized protein n=1 Tax=Brachionus plicatilis TaxID=10195 RepID=A0A3M7R624_BRAPC|nr:hypothetical protein BpHYR1_042289 [Brachionus plicatilis]
MIKNDLKSLGPFVCSKLVLMNKSEKRKRQMKQIKVCLFAGDTTSTMVVFRILYFTLLFVKYYFYNAEYLYLINFNI